MTTFRKFFGCVQLVFEKIDRGDLCPQMAADLEVALYEICSYR